MSKEGIKKREGHTKLEEGIMKGRADVQRTAL